jgi:allantoin racemase
MGLAACFAGTRAAAGASYALTRDPDRLRDALADAVRLCFDEDGAEAVIIGGGPLAAAAAELERMFARPVISPVRAAVERVGRKAFFF